MSAQQEQAPVADGGGAAAWDELRREVVRRISAIDDATPWQEVEPQWWLDMMAVQRAMLAARGVR